MDENTDLQKIIRNREKFSDLERSEETQYGFQEAKRIEPNLDNLDNQPTETQRPDLEPPKPTFRESFINRRRSNVIQRYITSRPAVLRPKRDPQLTLGIKESRKEILYRIKRRITRIEMSFEVMPFWKSALTVFSVVLGVVTILISFYFVGRYFKDLPQDIPFVYNEAQKAWPLINNSVFLSIPFIAIIFNLLQISFELMIYNYDKKLVYVISSIMMMFNALFIISIIQLLSFVIKF